MIAKGWETQIEKNLFESEVRKTVPMDLHKLRYSTRSEMDMIESKAHIIKARAEMKKTMDEE